MSTPRRYLRSVRLCSDPLPTTGTTRRVVPSSIRLARSSAIRTEIPAAPDVSISTTPRLIAATVACWATAVDGAESAAMRATSAVTLHAVKRLIGSLLLFGLDALQQDFRFGDAEFAGAPVPENRRRGIALNRTQLNPLEKVRIVGLPQSQRRLAVAGIGGPLVYKSRAELASPTPNGDHPGVMSESTRCRRTVYSGSGAAAHHGIHARALSRQRGRPGGMDRKASWHAPSLVSPTSLSGTNHPARDLAVSPVHPELSRRG